MDVEEVSLPWKLELISGFVNAKRAYASSSLKVLVYLQLWKKISLIFLDGWAGVTSHVCAITKALSKRPMK